MLLTLTLFLLTTVIAQEEITSTKSSLIFFTVNECEDCDAAKLVWDELGKLEPPDILLDEVNCDFQDRTCHDYQITKLPSVLFVSANGVREFEEEYDVDALMEFIENSETVLVQGEDLLADEEPYLLHLEEQDLEILGKSHSLVYFMYDEEVEHVEDFVLSLRAHISQEFDLPVYIIDCGVMADICVKEPFSVQILPSIKYLGERIATYTGDFLVERVEHWLQVYIFRTKEPDVDESIETITEDREDRRLVYISSDVEHENIAYMEGALLAFYLTEESTDLEDLFKTLSKKYRDTKDLQIFAIQCDEYNAPKACKEFDQLPVVKHGFMGRLVKVINFRTEEQFDGHIVKLLTIIAEGGHILEEEDEEEKVETMPKGESIEEASDVPERSGHALIVTGDNFNETLDNNRLVFLKFFVPWCGHCQKLKPTWKLLAQSFRDVTDIVIGMINCQNDQTLCKKHLVYGYPTMFTFIDGKQTYRYREERTLNSLIDHVKEKYYQAIEDDLKFNATPFHLSKRNVWNVLGVRKYTMAFFTAESCSACSSHMTYFQDAWKAVKSQPLLSDKMMLATVQCHVDLDLCKEMGVTQVPYIILYEIDEKIDPGSAPTDPLLHPFKAVQTTINSSPNHLTIDTIAWQKKTYDMRRELEEEEKARERRDTSSRSPSSKPKAAVPKTEAVTELGEDTFKGQLKKSRFTFVQFYAPWCGHCRKLAPIWTELGEKYLDTSDVVLAKINCDAHEKLCDKHKVTIYPTLYMFENDRKLKHVCKKRKKIDIITFVDKFLRSKPADGSKEPEEELPPPPAEVPDKRLKGIQGAVWQLDREDLLKLLDNKKNNFLFVLFYYESQKDGLKQLRDTWNRVATMYLQDQKIVMGQVDCDIELRLCLRYQSNTRKEYPQIFMFDKSTNVSFECLKRGEDQLIEYIEGFVDAQQKGPEKDEL